LANLRHQRLEEINRTLTAALLGTAYRGNLLQLNWMPKTEGYRVLRRHSLTLMVWLITLHSTTQDRRETGSIESVFKMYFTSTLSPRVCA